MRSLSSACRLLSFVFVCLSLPLAAIAQPENEGFDLERETKSLRLTKKDLPDVEGAQYAAVKARVKESEARMLLPGLNVMRPVIVTLQTRVTEEPLILRLVKTRWNKPVQECTTDAQGRCSLKLRTHGDLGLVVAKQGEGKGEFVLDALIGPRILVPPKRTALVEPDPSLTQSGFTLNPLYLVIGVLVLVIIFLLFGKKMFRKQAPPAALLLAVASTLLFSSGGEIHAQPGESGGPPANARQMDFDGLMNELRGMGEAGQALGDRMKDISHLSSLGEGVSDLFKRFGQVSDRLGELSSMLEAYETLSPDDGQYRPDIDERGLPDIPSMCANNPECQSCFGEAHYKFMDVRVLLEELRIIHSSTHKFAKAAMSFGDNVSGVHAVSGIAWQAERRKIEKSLKEMDQAYDAKYAELIDGTHAGLLGIAQCEDQYGLADWYNRFGFIYFEFLRDKYKRN